MGTSNRRTTAVATVTPPQTELEASARTKVTAEEAFAWRALEIAKTFVISDQAAYDLAAQYCRDVKAQITRLEASRKEITTSLLESKKRIDDLFRPATQLYRQAEDAFKRAMLASRAERREQLELFAGGAAASGAPVLAVPPAELEAQGVAVRRRRVVRVVNADLVPRALCSPDLAKIEAWLDAGGAAPEGLGIEVTYEETLAVGGVGKGS